MNAVSINVCIINHMSTNWPSVEPGGLSDMETSLDYCLCPKTTRVAPSALSTQVGCVDLCLEFETVVLIRMGTFFSQFRTGRHGKCKGNAGRTWCFVCGSVSLCWGETVV